MSSSADNSQVKMTHGFTTDSVKENLLMLMEAYPDKAWLVSVLCRKIFQNQAIRDTHQKDIKEILSQWELPIGWTYLDLRFQELDGILYNMNSPESRNKSDDFILRSNSSIKYDDLLKEELESLRNSFDTKIPDALDQNHQQEEQNKSAESKNSESFNDNSKGMLSSLIERLDDL